MQPNLISLPSTHADPPQPKSRVYVQLFSWFGLLISVLHLFEGRTLGIAQFFLSLLGIYASWDDVASRVSLIFTFAIGCIIWAIIDVLYLILLLTSTFPGLRTAAVNFLVSNTFPNLAPALENFLLTLAADIHFFSIFSAVTGVFFDALAAYWSFALYTDALNLVSSSHVRLPLVRSTSTTNRTGIAGFSSLSRQPQPSQPSPRSLHPFGGRGHRLGFGEI